MEVKQKEQQATEKRMMNLEFLRCVAMMMVIILHFLGKGDLLTPLSEETMDGVDFVAWGLEAFSIVAVNLYMMISGYFLCESNFKVSSLLRLLLQVFTYSVVFGALGIAFGFVSVEEITTYLLLRLLFPISMGHYWFMTAYVFLYLLLPFLSMAIKRMSKEQMKLTTILLLFTFSIMKSVLPLRLDMDQKGFDCLWYLCVFLVAAYIRKFGFPLLQKKTRALGLYVAGSLLIFCGTMLLRMIYLKTGSLRLILGVMLEYNHIFPLIAAVGLFMLFLQIEVTSVIGTKFAQLGSCTLGVYLLHENLNLRYSWQSVFGAERIHSVGGLLLGTVFAVIVVFAVGVCVEKVRRILMKGLHKVLYNISVYRKGIEGLMVLDRLWDKEP